MTTHCRWPASSLERLHSTRFAALATLLLLPIGARAEDAPDSRARPEYAAARAPSDPEWRWDLDALVGGEKGGAVLGVGAGLRRELVRLGFHADLVGAILPLDRFVPGPGPDIARNGLDVAANIGLVKVDEVAATRSAFAGARWRADVVGELGQRWVWVREFYPAGTRPDFVGHAGRYAPFVGARFTLGGRLGRRFDSCIGLGGLVRWSRTQSVPVDGGSRGERVGGWVVGAFAYVLLELPRDHPAADASDQQ